MTTIVNKKKIKVVLEKAKRKTWWYGVMITNISKLESSVLGRQLDNEQKDYKPQAAFTYP